MNKSFIILLASARGFTRVMLGVWSYGPVSISSLEERRRGHLQLWLGREVDDVFIHSPYMPLNLEVPPETKTGRTASD